MSEEGQNKNPYQITLPFKIIYVIFLVLIIIFTIILLIVYIKDRNFHVTNINAPGSRMKLYICYFNIFFCIIIVIEDVLRLIPESIGLDDSVKEDDPNFICRLQAISASFFDKLLLSNMTIYSIITFLGVFYSEFYKNYLKKIYLILILVGVVMSLGLTIAYAREGISYKDMVCSIHTRTELKRISDTIYTSLLFLINLICLVSLIIYLYRLRNMYKFDKKAAQFQKSTNFLKRYLLDLFITIFAFTYILLAVNKVFARGSYKDIIYIIICLAVELFFTLNRTLYEAFIRTLTCNKYYKESVNDSNQDQDQDQEQDLEQDQYNKYTNEGES
jgi:hypothetical protein